MYFNRLSKGGISTSSLNSEGALPTLQLFKFIPQKKRKPGNGSCQLNLNLILKIATIKSFDDTHSIGA